MFQDIKRFIEDALDWWADHNRTLKVAKIRRVYLREGGLIGGSLSRVWLRICDHPGRCAVGALLAAAGVLDEDLKQSYGYAYTPFLRTLRDTYGLTGDQAYIIVTANDDTPGSVLGIECGGLNRPLSEVRVCVGIRTVEEMARA